MLLNQKMSGCLTPGARGLTKSVTCKLCWQIKCMPFLLFTHFTNEKNAAVTHTRPLFAKWDAVDIFDLCVSRAHKSLLLFTVLLI